MTHATRFGIAASLALAFAGSPSMAADTPAGMTRGTPEMKSAGPISFGPDGILFVGDTAGGAIFAVATGDTTPAPAHAALKVEKINEKVAAMLGTDAKGIAITDMAVNPASGKAYLSIMRGQGASAMPAIVRVDGTGKVEMVPTKDVDFARASLPNPTAGTGPRSPRSDAITDLAFLDGKVYVAGLSNENFSSRLLAIPYPFVESGDGTSVEIFHGAHGGFETKSPIRTFAAYMVKGEPHIMAAYTCTPLVKIPVSDLKPGAHIKGVTVAELGNRNKPLDMVVYTKGGKDYILMANSARGVMKIPAEGVASAESIVEPVKSEKKGMPYETIASLKGVDQLDRLDATHAVIIARDDAGMMNLTTIEMP